MKTISFTFDTEVFDKQTEENFEKIITAIVKILPKESSTWFIQEDSHYSISENFDKSLDLIEKNRNEIGTHVHFSTQKVSAQKEELIKATKTLRKNFDATSFRSGYHFYNNYIARMLSEEKYLTDSSIVPGLFIKKKLAKGFLKSNFLFFSDSKPFILKNILEIPVSVFPIQQFGKYLSERFRLPILLETPSIYVQRALDYTEKTNLPVIMSGHIADFLEEGRISQRKIKNFELCVSELKNYEFDMKPIRKITFDKVKVFEKRRFNFYGQDLLYPVSKLFIKTKNL